MTIVDTAHRLYLQAMAEVEEALEVFPGDEGLTEGRDFFQQRLADIELQKNLLQLIDLKGDRP